MLAALEGAIEVELGCCCEDALRDALAYFI
jgi:hypothetical protein